MPLSQSESHQANQLFGEAAAEKEPELPSVYRFLEDGLIGRHVGAQDPQKLLRDVFFGEGRKLFSQARLFDFSAVVINI